MRNRPPSSGQATDRDDSTKTVFRPILLLAVTVFIDLLGFGIILPNLPRYIELAVGKTTGDAAFVGGLLGASYSLTQFLCAPFWGRYSDRAGRRPVILISLLGVGLAYLFFGFSDGHLWMLFTARLLAGLLSSASIGVSFAYVADVTTPANRAKGMGLLGACFGLGFMMGPALGGILGKVSLGLPAFVAAGMALINFFFSVKMLPESLSLEERQKLAAETHDGLTALVQKVMSGPTAGLYVLSFISIFGFAAIEQAFGFFLLARGIATSGPQGNLPERFGYLMGFVGIVGIIIQGGLIGRLVRTVGEGPLAIAGMVVLILGYIIITLPRHWGVEIFLCCIPLSAGRSLMGPAISSLISRKSNLGQGLNLSVQQSFDALARTVGPLTAGALFKQFGATAPYYFSGALTAFALLMALAVPSILRLEPTKATT